MLRKKYPKDELEGEEVRNGIGDGVQPVPKVSIGGSMLQKLLSKFGYVKEVDYCAYCRQIRYFKAKRLDDLEEALKAVPDTAQMGGGAVIEKDGKVELVTLTSKDQALKLITSARKGELRLVF
jgi:hypothetical protein